MASSAECPKAASSTEPAEILAHMALLDRIADETLNEWNLLACLESLCQARAPRGHLALRRMPLVLCAALLRGPTSSRQQAVIKIDEILMSWNEQYSPRDRSGFIKELVRELQAVEHSGEDEWKPVFEWALASLRAFSTAFHADLNVLPSSGSTRTATTATARAMENEGDADTQALHVSSESFSRPSSTSSVVGHADAALKHSTADSVKRQREVGTSWGSNSAPATRKRQLSLDGFLQEMKRTKTEAEASVAKTEKEEETEETLKTRCAVTPPSHRVSISPRVSTLPATVVDSPSGSDVSPKMQNAQKAEHVPDTFVDSSESSTVNENGSQNVTSIKVADSDVPTTPAASDKLSYLDLAQDTPAACDKPAGSSQETSCDKPGKGSSQETLQETPLEPKMIDVSVVAQGSNGVFDMVCQIEEDKPFAMIMDAFCKYQELERKACRFLVHGTSREIEENDTAQKLEWDSKQYKVHAIPAPKGGPCETA